ncbi:MAG TPA: S9 family peptidase [Vicinamibacterales bacterium]|nr:S9 family peptidase [Vicinamibacterales bacterium]
MHSRRTLVLTFLLLSVSGLAAQRADPAAALRAQIDHIFKDHAYDPPRFGPARWLPDGTAYAIVERNGSGTEIARYDAMTGARTVTVRPEQLVPKGAERPLDIEDYEWSSDGRRLLIFTNTRKVWRQNTRGDYWVLDTRSGAIRELGGDAPEASLMFAAFSPDGTRVAYVRGNNLYAESADGGSIVQLTTDGTPLPAGAAWSPAVGGDKGTIVNGTSDWVNEEELNIRSAFRWSPDSRRIAYWQFDTSGVGDFTLIDDTDTLYPVTKTFAYPKPGTKNSRVRIGVVAADGGATTWMQTPGDPREKYLASLEWIDANTIAMQQLNRLQSEDDYLIADVATGAVTVALRDGAPSPAEGHAWVDAQDSTIWFDGGRSFLWLSERDGWRHVYKAGKGGGNPVLLTRFDADVISLVGIDEQARVAYFLASPSNATQKYLYRASLDGGSVPVRVTPQDEPGTHGYTLAPGAKLAFHTYSRFDRPSSMDLVSLPDHQVKRGITDVGPLEKTLAGIISPPVEFLKVDVGNGVTLDGWMMKPRAFDPSRKYPVIVHVYGEPASQTVTDSWGGGRTLFHRALADAGYIVVSFDNRGTPAPKGAAWRKVVYGAVGDLSSKEQAAAIRALAAAHPFVDPDRVGIWGWSGGGTNTLNAMFRFPDVYKAGVAVAPVPDQRLYDTIYQERYMGVPQENAEGYHRGSAINFAEGLRGSLLIVHGSGDDNVHYQGTERLVNRLVELGRPFDLMVYPNRTHAIAEGPGTTVHIYQLIARYFVEHLPPGPR